MKKKNIIALIIILMILFIKTNVNAATNVSCSTTDLSVYRLEANNVSATIELVKRNPNYNPESNPYHYNLVISNITQNISVKALGFDYLYKDSNNGEIIIENAFYGGGYNAKVQIVTSDTTGCGNKILNTITIKVPYWNEYSEREECKGYENLDICRINTNVGKVSSDQFLEIFEKQKKEYEKSSQKEKDNFNILNWYLDNKKTTIPITIAVVVIAVAIIIIKLVRDRKKIKINLGGEL